jgi:hypothetical protein
VDSPRPARTQDFAWQLEWLALCESKIAVSLGVVSFLCFVSLDKQRNEQKSIIILICEFIRTIRIFKTRINESRRQTIAAGISKNEVRAA